MTKIEGVHANLHGFTVVLYTAGPMTYIGRWDEEVGDLIFLNDATVHREGEEGMTRDEFIFRAVKFGPRVTCQRCEVGAGEVTEIRTLGELSRKLPGV